MDAADSWHGWQFGHITLDELEKVDVQEVRNLLKDPEDAYNSDMDIPKVKGIIFDFNGVIVDDYPLQKEAWSQLSLILRNRPVTDQEMVQKIRGVPTRDAIVWMSTKTLSLAAVEEFVQTKTNITKELFDTSPLFRLAPGLEVFLNSLSGQNIPRTIATSSTKSTFSHLFDTLSLGRWFNKEQIICFDNTYPGKPAPDAYILAARSINLQPIECVVAEDAISGITSAHAAGVRNIIVVGRDEQLREFASLPGVIRTIHDFSEVNMREFFS